MRRSLLSLTLSVLAPAFLCFLPIELARAQTETVLHSFGGQAGDGLYPSAGLALDKSGNVYGTTNQGGAQGLYGTGAVFEVTSGGAEEVLYSFNYQIDGGSSNAGLIFDKKGNLYGTTGGGGSGGFGSVFELTSQNTEKVLYSFRGGPDGGESSGNLVRDAKGNLYGTTYWGGTQNYGVVFKLTSKGVETPLHSFTGPPADGYYPTAGLALDNEGNLYGTTPFGGANGYGTVFEVTSDGSEKLLYSFGNYPGDAIGPEGGLILHNKGTLYGTTSAGGANNLGTVFELTPDGTEKILYSFGSHAGDGYDPETGNLVFDKKGNLYGETVRGGATGCGTVFELTRKGIEKVLYSFGAQLEDGCYPQGGVVLDAEGNVYGTTFEGGTWGVGTVFKVVP